AQRLERFTPALAQTNLLAPIAPGLAPFDSVGLTYVLHCLPGSMSEKLVAVDHLRPLMGEGAVLFGATILGRGRTPNRAARALLDLYNAKGVFNNREDDLASLSEGLRERFPKVEVETQGLVALFRAA
ncbi:MAG: methyltransferase type 12, partial [Methyloceanibacter sp.]